MPHLIRIQCAHRHLTPPLSRPLLLYYLEANKRLANEYERARDKVAMKYNDFKSLLCSLGMFFSLSLTLALFLQISIHYNIVTRLTFHFFSLSLSPSPLSITIWQTWTFDGRKRTEKTERVENVTGRDEMSDEGNIECYLTFCCHLDWETGSAWNFPLILILFNIYLS